MKKLLVGVVVCSLGLVVGCSGSGSTSVKQTKKEGMTKTESTEKKDGSETKKEETKKEEPKKEEPKKEEPKKDPK